MFDFRSDPEPDPEPLFPHQNETDPKHCVFLYGSGSVRLNMILIFIVILLDNCSFHHCKTHLHDALNLKLFCRTGECRSIEGEIGILMKHETICQNKIKCKTNELKLI